jgi:branched-chain amino acid transport system ATP-binding protein
VSLIVSNEPAKQPFCEPFPVSKSLRGVIVFKDIELKKIEPSKIVTSNWHTPRSRHIFPTMTVEENLEMGAFSDPAGWTSTLEDVYKRFPA